MNEIQEFLPFLIPIMVIQLTLMAVAFFDLFKRERTRGPKWMWVLIILLVNLIGPIIYFAIGREE